MEQKWISQSLSAFQSSQSSFLLQVFNLIIIIDICLMMTIVADIFHMFIIHLLLINVGWQWQGSSPRGIVLTGCQWVPQRENLSWNHRKQHLAFGILKNCQFLFGFVRVLASLLYDCDCHFLLHRGNCASQDRVKGNRLIYMKLVNQFWKSM